MKQALGMIETKGLVALFEATDAGAEAASRIGEVVSVQVISRPHDELPSFVQNKKAAPQKAAAAK